MTEPLIGKARRPEFFHGPRDGESAETYTTQTARWQHPRSDQMHLYMRAINGDYEYLGLRIDVIGAEDGA